jgi:uncharacterized protein with PQ loop repeat
MTIDVMQALGWIGSFMLAFCGLPEVIKTVREGECTLTWGFLIMWGVGEICLLIPVITQGMAPFLTLNYSVNVLFLLILLWYKTGEAIRKWFF